MTDAPHPFFERYERWVKKLQGVAKPKRKAGDDKVRFATFQDRVIASVIDMSIIFLLLQGVFSYITGVIYSFVDVSALQVGLEQRPDAMTPLESMRYKLDTALDAGLVQLWIANSFAQSLLIGVILVLVWREFHSTPGKYLIGIEFAGKNGEGKPITRDYLLRFAGFYLSMPFFMIGFAMLGLDKQKRAWHDRIGGTTVIYAERGSIFMQLWRWLRGKKKS